MPITIRDVAKAAGVSVATVSRVANLATNDYPIRPATRARVLDAIATLGYRPNDNARGLLRNSSGVIGLLVPDISNPYYPEVLRGIEDVAAVHGYKVMFCSTDRDPVKARDYIDALLLKRVDGIVIVGGGDEIELSDQLMTTYDTKVVFVGRPSSVFSTVRIDNLRAARDATRHLLSLGHTRVGFLSASAKSRTSRERERGYRSALHESGLEFDKALVADGDFTEEGGYAGTRRLLGLPTPPTAIFAANDRMAAGAMGAVVDTGLRVPRDVALVGFDDVPMARFLRPALTTVSVSAHELGARAMDLLVDGINGSPSRRRVQVQTRLIVRDSCGAAVETTKLPADTASDGKAVG